MLRITLATLLSAGPAGRRPCLRVRRTGVPRHRGSRRDGVGRYPAPATRFHHRCRSGNRRAGPGCRHRRACDCRRISNNPGHCRHRASTGARRPHRHSHCISPRQPPHRLLLPTCSTHDSAAVSSQPTNTLPPPTDAPNRSSGAHRAPARRPRRNQRRRDAPSLRHEPAGRHAGCLSRPGGNRASGLHALFRHLVTSLPRRVTDACPHHHRVRRSG